MSSVYVTSTVQPYNPDQGHEYGDTERFIRCADADKFTSHRRVTTPDSADLILFIGSQRPDLLDVRRHPLTRQRIEDTFIFHMGDKIVPRVPGVYTCLERTWHAPGRTRSGHYTQVAEYENCVPGKSAASASLLYSFVGNANTHVVRQNLSRITDPRGKVLLTQGTARVIQPLIRAEYYSLMRDSMFVLCPRGLGSSSFRLFEAMRLGRSPVILSDEWVPPTGPDWASFSIRMRESRYREIPWRLRQMEPLAHEMGRRAREAYETWFAQDVAFHRVIEWCLEIKQCRRWPERVLRCGVAMRLLAPSRLLSRLINKTSRPAQARNSRSGA